MLSVVTTCVRKFAVERPDLVERWHILFVFPASFDDKAAAAVWDVPEAEGAGQLASRSGDSSIATTRPAVSRSTFVAELPRSPSDIFGSVEDGPSAAQEKYELTARRHAIHYASLTRELSDSDSSTAALRECCAHISPGVAEYRGWACLGCCSWLRRDRGSMDMHCYTVTAMPFLLVRRSPADIEQWLNGARDMARPLDDSNAAIALSALGSAYGELGRRETEAACYLEALGPSNRSRNRFSSPKSAASWPRLMQTLARPTKRSSSIKRL